MLRDVPYCRSILALGMGGLILSVVMLTWVYPAFCCKVSQVKETKVRELMEDNYGISDRSGAMFTTVSHENELAKTDESDVSTGAEITAEAEAEEMAGAGTDRVDEANVTPADASLPAAKRH